jgi:preprotein translocase subunit SecD
MKSKLHFGILILLITFIVRFLENPIAPNQQIVIQFSNTEVNDKDAEQTINAITSKLHSIGVEKIKVGQDKSGHLKITYYSTTDTKEIKNILSGSKSIKLTYGVAKKHSSKTPAEKKSETYKLDVSEIHENNTTTDWDFNGVELVEHNQKSDRFNHLKKHTSVFQIHSDLFTQSIKVIIASNTKDVFTDNHSYIIPEVRAGPLA